MALIGSIGFKNLKVNCIIGVFDEERVSPQDIFVDLKVEADFASARSDRFECTIDYVSLATLCGDLAKNEYCLLEKYASEVLDRIFSAYPVRAAWIKVKKPKAIALADCAFVELYRVNE